MSDGTAGATGPEGVGATVATDGWSWQGMTYRVPNGRRQLFVIVVGLAVPVVSVLPLGTAVRAIVVAVLLAGMIVLARDRRTTTGVSRGWSKCQIARRSVVDKDTGRPASLSQIVVSSAGIGGAM